MGTRYQVLSEGGVWDFETRTRITRDKTPAAWRTYQAWLTSGGVPLPPDRAGQLDLAAAQAEKLEEINAWAAALRNQVIRGRSVGEMASWTIKLMDAMALSAGQPSPFAALLPALSTALGLPATANSINDALGQARGLDEAAHAGKVLSQAVPFLVAEVALDAVRGKHCDAITALIDVRDVITYDWRAGWPTIPGA